MNGIMRLIWSLPQSRYFSSVLGRFSTVDPINLKKDRLFDPQRINLYAYVRNSPLTYVDVDGKDLLLVAKNEDEAKKRFEIYQKGFDPKDRGKVTLVVGNGKNGYKAGEFGVKIDSKAKGKDDNFRAAQTVANSDKRTTIAVVAPGDKFQANYSITDENGKTTTSSAEAEVTAKEGLPGLTLPPLPRSGILDPQGVYSNTPNTEVYVASDQDDQEISATMHHEVRAHGEPIALGRPYGHTPKFNNDNVPRNDIDRNAVDSEKRAKKNFKKP